jgi:hypothetical protein
MYHYISFIITCYNDYYFLESSLKSLRKIYPNTIVSVITDGDNNSKIKNICNKFNALFFYFDRSYAIECGFKFWRNIFKVYDSNPTEFLIKLDTDVRIDREITLTKDYYDCMFGTIRNLPKQFIQNGIRGFHKNVIQQIKNSSYYYNDSHFTNKFLEGKIFDTLNKYKSNNLISTEFLMYEMCTILENIKIKDHPEIMSYWFNTTKNHYNHDKDNFSKEKFINIIKTRKPAIIHPWHYDEVTELCLI